MQLPFKQVWHPYENWEEIRYNMWGNVSERQKYLQMAIKFTGNHKLYGSYMLRVVEEWPISCENALTDNTLNKQAWIGHAACALAIRCPEDITRKAWSFLTDEQQLLANKEARRAIQRWADNYRQSEKIHRGVESEVLL
jgi:hypothetical protein